MAAADPGLLVHYAIRDLMWHAAVDIESSSKPTPVIRTRNPIT
jgi:hypothetical protein